MQLWTRCLVRCARARPAHRAKRSPQGNSPIGDIRGKDNVVSATRSLSSSSRQTSEEERMQEPVEEETMPGYRANRYYPVHPAQQLNNRYRVIGKLGFGATSTVWLCRDQRYDAEP